MKKNKTQDITINEVHWTVKQILLPAALILVSCFAISNLGFNYYNYIFLSQESLDTLVKGLRHAKFINSSIGLSSGHSFFSIISAALLLLKLDDLVIYLGLIFHIITAVIFTTLLVGIVSNEILLLTFVLLISSVELCKQALMLNDVFGVVLFLIISSTALLHYSKSRKILWAIITIATSLCFILIDNLWINELKILFFDISIHRIINNAIQMIDLLFNALNYPTIVLSLIGTAYICIKFKRSFLLTLIFLILIYLSIIMLFGSVHTTSQLLPLFYPIYLLTACGFFLLIDMTANIRLMPVRFAINSLLLGALVYFNIYKSNQLYLTTYIKDVQLWLSKLDIQDINEPLLSEKYYDFFSKLKSNNVSSTPRFLIYDPNGVESDSVRHFRNSYYLKADINTVQTVGEILSKTNEEDVILIGDMLQLKSLINPLKGLSLDTPIAKHSNLIAVSIQKKSLRLFQSIQPAFIKDVVAAEYPEHLFDGITDDPRYWAASPYNKPIEFTFVEPRLLTKFNLHLFDFDSRYYWFTLEYQVANNSKWKQYASFTDGEPRGFINLPLPSVPITGLRIIGKFNSHTKDNPQNQTIHICEVEIQ